MNYSAKEENQQTNSVFQWMASRLTVCLDMFFAIKRPDLILKGSEF